MLYFENNYKQIASLLFHRPVSGEKYAIQCNITGEGAGVFYIENMHGKLNIEPYEYIDNDVIISANFDTYMLLAISQLTVDKAIDTGLLQVLRGNVEYVREVFRK